MLNDKQRAKNVRITDPDDCLHKMFAQVDASLITLKICLFHGEGDPRICRGFDDNCPLADAEDDK